jgi:hypothetical protein
MEETMLIKIKDRYFFYGSASDSPTTWGLTEAEAYAQALFEKGESGVTHWRNAPARASERLKEEGADYYADILACNRSGPDEAELSADEIYQAYHLREAIRDGWYISDDGWSKEKPKKVEPVNRAVYEPYYYRLTLTLSSGEEFICGGIMGEEEAKARARLLFGSAEFQFAIPKWQVELLARNAQVQQQD